MSEIRINPKSILFTILGLGLITMILFYLNGINEKRKEKEFNAFYQQLEGSPYFDTLESYITDFDTGNVEIASKIYQTLQVIKFESQDDFSVELIIKNRQGYATFERYYRGKEYFTFSHSEDWSERKYFMPIRGKEEEAAQILKGLQASENHFTASYIIRDAGEEYAYLVTSKRRKD